MYSVRVFREKHHYCLTGRASSNSFTALAYIGPRSSYNDASSPKEGVWDLAISRSIVAAASCPSTATAISNIIRKE